MIFCCDLYFIVIHWYIAFFQNLSGYYIISARNERTIRTLLWKPLRQWSRDSKCPITMQYIVIQGELNGLSDHWSVSWYYSFPIPVIEVSWKKCFNWFSKKKQNQEVLNICQRIHAAVAPSQNFQFGLSKVTVSLITIRRSINNT